MLLRLEASIVILYLPRNLLKAKDMSGECLILNYEGEKGHSFQVVFEVVEGRPAKPLEASLRVRNELLGRDYARKASATASSHSRNGPAVARNSRTSDDRLVLSTDEETSIKLEIKQLPHAQMVEVSILDSLKHIRASLDREWIRVRINRDNEDKSDDDESKKSRRYDRSRSRPPPGARLRPPSS